MKVTMGRVSRYGAMPLSYTLDTVGPLTRTVRDNAMMLAALAGYDENDPSSANESVGAYVEGLEIGVKGLTIGVPTSHFLDDITPELGDRFHATVDILKAAGANIVDVDMPSRIGVTNALTSIVTSAEGAAIHQHWMETRPDDYGTQTFSRFAGGLSTPATRYIQALNLRTDMLAEFNEMVFGKVDVLMTPRMTMDIPPIAETDVRDGENAAELLGKVGHCSRPVNFLGLPGLAVPSGFAKSGLPSSVQFVGRPFDEATLYRVGRAYERETDWTDQMPDVSGWAQS